jgi:aryl-alcohol dehydrogenase
VGRTCTAAVVTSPGGEFTLEEVELDDLRSGEALVRIEACGVCNTDMMAQRRVPLPAVLGHEGAGVVEEIGRAVTTVQPGDRVMISWPSCGECPSCAAGRPYECDDVSRLNFGGARADGSHTVKLEGQWISSPFFQQSSFATYVIAPASSLVRSPADMPFHLVAALQCGLMTGAGSIVNTFAAGARNQLMVFGTGAVGLSAIMAARIVGVYPIVAVDVNDDRLALALELGATYAFNATRDDIPAGLKELLPRGVSHALDTTGLDSSWSIASTCLAMGGTLGAVHVPGGDTLHFRATEMIKRSAQFKFIMAGSALPRDFLPQLIDWYRQGRYPFDRLVKTFAFADINVAFAESKAGRAIKPVLVMA